MSAEMQAIDQVGHIETHGIDFIPEIERHSTPRSVAIVFFGTQLTYGALIVGALPIAFGLSLLSSFTAILLGTLLGTAGFAGMIVIGSRTGTNGVVSSGAFFGIRGRYIGSLITEIVDLGYFAMGFWVGAQPLVEAAHRLFGTSTGGAATAVALVIATAGVLGTALLGHATIVAYEKIASVAGLAALAVLVLFSATSGGSAHHRVPHYALGSFWPTWTMALTAQIANAISYGPFASDYSRYVPARTSLRSLFIWSFLGMFAGCVVALGAGAYIGSVVADPNSIIGGMIAFLPLWLVFPVTLLAFVSNTMNGSMVVYNGILNLQTVLWRMKRVRVGVIFSVMGATLGVAGFMITDFSDRIDALCSVVTVLVTPWLMINVIGFLKARGRVDPEALQDFAHAKPRNLYWFRGGYNVQALASWSISTLVGLMFSNTHLYVGPLASLAGGADLSFVSSAIVGVVLYIVLDPALYRRDAKRAASTAGT